MTDSTSLPVPLTANWNEKKKKLKAKFNMLSDEDLTFEIGKENIMLNGIQIILGKTKHELAAIIAAL